DWSARLEKTPLREKRGLAGRCGWALFVLCKRAHLALVLVVPLIVGHLNGIGWGWVLLSYAISQMFASLLVVFLLLG
ncbi:acyl-CoA desaturase, partial [Serratia marcescens]|nr:acyl-CoA desaturase [Serratia marcescens]